MVFRNSLSLFGKVPSILRQSSIIFLLNKLSLLFSITPPLLPFEEASKLISYDIKPDFTSDSTFSSYFVTSILCSPYSSIFYSSTPSSGYSKGFATFLTHLGFLTIWDPLFLLLVGIEEVALSISCMLPPFSS